VREGATTGRIVRFTDDDLRLFSRASSDRNPLHLDSDYSRTTQFGQRVVFGVLGGLCCAGAFDGSSDRGVVGLNFDFVGPVFCGIDYTLRTQVISESRVSVVLSEGARPLVKALFRLGPPQPTEQLAFHAAAPLRAEAATLDRADIAAGMQRGGVWRTEAAAFAALLGRLGLPNGSLTNGQVAALLWSSYIVGMELPGRRALFNSVAFDFAHGGPDDGALAFESTVTAYDDRFGLLRIDFTLGDFARGQIRAFVREPSDSAADADPELQEPSGALAGKIALVVGASRGLGAHIARTLAAHGAVVHASYMRSSQEIERLRSSLGTASDRLVPLQGDGADPSWCAQMAQRIRTERGGLDILVCNASPSILPMWFDAETAARTTRYVAESLDLVGAPMAASLGMLSERSGWMVVISSMYAEGAPANYPHYVAAKGAIEGLVRAVAHHYDNVSFLIVRPPRLAGELDIPFAGATALRGSQVAAVLARRLEGEQVFGEAETLAEFEQ
jgi:NAD(P)-dependent dehydrogenase (short-subunit alcohol dehydrogenase family)